MRTRVGIAIAYDAVRAVVVRGRELLWAGEVEREPGTPTPESIAALVSGAPLRRRPRRVATFVAVGPHASQVKKLSGLPPVEDPETLSAMIRENASAFFIGDAADLRTTGVRQAETGETWSATIDASYIESARRACRSLRLRLVAIAPSAAVLPFAVRSERFERSDGPVTLEIEASNGALAWVRRAPASANSDREPIQTVDALASLNERAEIFADAYGATVAPTGDPLTLGPAGDVPWARRRRLRRILPPAIAASAAAVALLLSPLIPWFTARNAESRLREIYASEEWQLTMDVRSQLQRATAVLSEIERFAASGRRSTALLASLGRALPETAALERFDARDGQVRIMVVAPQAASVVEAIREISGVASVTVPGATARAQVGGRELERVTLTFEHASRAAVGSPAFKPGRSGDADSVPGAQP